MSTTTRKHLVAQSAKHPSAKKTALGPRPLAKQLKPWKAMGAVFGAGLVERALAHMTGHGTAAAWVTAVVAALLAAYLTSNARQRVLNTHLRRRFIAAAWAGAGWLTYLAVVGLSWNAVVGLLLGGTLLSLLYWREHRITGLEAAEVPAPDGDRYADLWRDNLAESGELAGSKLTNREVLQSGFRYTLRLIPGKHQVDTARARVALIRSGLRLLPGQQVIVEEHPDEPSPTGLLTVITKSKVLQTDQAWPGPDLSFDSARGCVNVGPFIDGEGVCRWAVYVQDGIFGGFLQGAPGSGKSRMVESIAMATASSKTHPTIVWFGCGQNGDSSPLLVDVADYVATTGPAMLDMLTAAEKVMYVNGVENRMATPRRRGFTPTPERPGLLIIIDEFHNFLNEKLCPQAVGITEKIAKIAREGRKVGVALILSTQNPLLGDFGSQKTADLIRGCLLNGNGVVLRSDSTTAQQVFKIDVSPRTFPKLPGYAYLAKPAEGERAAPFRGYYVDDAQIDRWAHSFTWRSLPQRQARFAGEPYAKRRQVVDVQQHDDEFLLSMLDDESFTDLGPFTPAMEEAQKESEIASPTTPGTAFGENMPGVARVEKFWMKPKSSPASELNEGQKKILDAIRAGHQTPGDIVTATSYNRQHVHTTLNALLTMGLIQKDGYGKYGLAA